MMFNKNRITLIVIVLAVLLGGFYLWQSKQERPPVVKELLPLPNRDNPSPSGLYSNVPPFEEWEWVEKKDESDQLIYRIKLPPVQKYIVDAVDFRNMVDLLDIPRDAPGYIYIGLENSQSANIDQFYEHSEKFFLRKWTEQIRNANLGRYRAHLVRNLFYEYEYYQYYFLTKKFLISMIFDFDKDCLYVEDIRQQCTEYYQIYLPIVEKALSTLEIPDYVDDRGFAPEELWEIKLLPDALRIYEVK